MVRAARTPVRLRALHIVVELIVGLFLLIEPAEGSADHGEFHTGRFDLGPIDGTLPGGYVDAVFLHMISPITFYLSCLCVWALEYFV